MRCDSQKVEILKRRNKKSNPCISDGLNYDETLLNEYLSNVECTAPYRSINKSGKICDSKNKLKASACAFDAATGYSNSKIACTS